MKTAMWMVIKDDEYYVDMAINSVIDHVDAIYVQDQDSYDNSVEVVKETVGERVPLVIEIVKTKLPKFHIDYNEPYYRSLAILRVETLFPECDWILQQDADDLYTPFFFEQVKKIEESGEIKDFNSFRHSSERFITPEYRTVGAIPTTPFFIKQVINGVSYHDPHTRLWRARQGVYYRSNPRVDGFLHCIIAPEPTPVRWIPGICNIHLHRMFGPKAFAFWREGGDVFEATKPFNPRRQAPKWFEHHVNMGAAEYCPHEWPEYVMRKWREWGSYE